MTNILLPLALLAFLGLRPVTALGRQNVQASCFNDSTGNRGNNLYDGGYYYAELSTNFRQPDYRALTGLPNGHALRITYNGRSITATKGDVGAGGSKNPKIDLHIVAARALGFNINICEEFGIKTVTIESV